VVCLKASIRAGSVNPNIPDAMQSVSVAHSGIMGFSSIRNVVGFDLLGWFAVVALTALLLSYNTHDSIGFGR
jgi:hypothetical protein